MEKDYKELLKKYMQLIIEMESDSFLQYLPSGSNITKDELQELENIEKEIHAWKENN